jgi:uncharacterized protein YceK
MSFRLLCMLIVLVAITSGCSSITSSVAPDISLNEYEKFYVVRVADDEHAINNTIRDSLIARGLEAKTGFEQGIPSDTQVKVTFKDKWHWDITWYLKDLKIFFHDPNTNSVIARGRSYRPSLERTSVENMVIEILDKLFMPPPKER